MSEGVWCVWEGCSSNLLFSVCSGCDGKRQCVCVANVTKAAFHLLFGGVSGPGIHYPVPAWIRKEKRTW